MKTNEPRPYWSSMTIYLLVTTGAIVGLGNITRFPYYVYKFGGSFVLFYILCELLISLPILFAELIIGRRGKQNPVGAFSILAMETGATRRWRWLGWLCFIILFLSLSSYSVSVSYPVAYLSNLFKDTLAHFYNFISPVKGPISNQFVMLEMCFIAFLFVTMLVILRGIKRGLETISRITVPTYFIILLGLAIYSCVVGNFSQAVSYLFDFTPNYDTWTTVLFAALMYAFFKLGVGMGIMIVYGSYLPYSVPLGRSTLLIICFDAIISLLAYFVIYPLFTSTHELMSTMQEFHDTLYSFSHTAHGSIITTCFIFATLIAAWTPTIAMAESATVILIERFNLSRVAATLIVFSGAFLLGTFIVFSITVAPNFTIFHVNVMTAISNLTNKILIPISALLTAIFAGWVLKRSITENELGFKPRVYQVWQFLVRFVVPISIVVIVMMILPWSF